MREKMHTRHFLRNLVVLLIAAWAIASLVRWVVELLGLHLSLFWDSRLAVAIAAIGGYVLFVRPALSALADRIGVSAARVRASSSSAGFAIIRGEGYRERERSRLRESFRSAGFNRLRGREDVTEGRS